LDDTYTDVKAWKAEYDETDVENLKQVAKDKIDEKIKMDMIIKRASEKIKPGSLQDTITDVLTNLA